MKIFLKFVVLRFEDLVFLFYANPCVSQDSGELEILVLDTIFVLRNFLFERIFDINSFGGISYMNRIWPDDFEVSIEGVK